MVKVNTKWAGQAAFIAILAFFFLEFYRTPYVIGDPIWSNVIGQWMFAHHAIPTHDHWAWTAVGQAWMPQEWGFEIFLYGVNHAFGFRGVVLMMTLVSTLTWVVLADLLRLQGKSYPMTVALLTAAISTPWDQIRAEVFSYLFFALTLWIIEKAKKRSNMLLWLLPLEVIWTNIHGSFELGIGVVLWLGIVAWIPSFDWGWIQHSQSKEMGKLRVYAAIGMALVSLINPQGFHLYEFAYWLSFQSHVAKYILEWQPATITEGFTLLFISEFVVFALIRLQRKEAVRLSTLFWALGTLYMFLKAVRFGSYLLIALPWALAPDAAFTLRWLSKHTSLPKIKTVFTLGVFVGISILCIQSTLKTDGTLYQNAANSVNPKAVQVAVQIEKKHPHWRIWNDYNLGDMLEAEGVPVSVDGRTEVYLANGIMSKYMDTMMAYPSALSILKEEHIRIALIQSQAPLVSLLSLTHRWVRVYQAQGYSVYEKSGWSQ